MDRRVTPPKRVTSPSWGPPPPCKQALSATFEFRFESFKSISLLILFVYKLMIGSSKITEKIIRENALEYQKKKPGFRQ